MKHGLSVEPELDSFSLTLPLPYRVALLVVLGVWGWGVNLHYLYLLKIDLPSLINYPPRASPRTDAPHHFSAYCLALLLSVPFALSLCLFWALSQRVPLLVLFYDFLPLTYLSFLFAIIFLPIFHFASAGRWRFLTILRRISVGGLAQAHDGKFGDILLADVLTSYAKVIADLFVSLCMFFSSSHGSATARPDRGCGGQYLVPIIISIPSLIRLRQCVTEFRRVRTAGGPGSGGQHLANAIKYASALPVTILSALQRQLSINHENIGLSERTVYRLWILAILVNSMYSFYWDVSKDWDLSLFSSLRDLLATTPRIQLRTPTFLYMPIQLHYQFPTNQAFGLRRRLALPNLELYYFAIVMDFLLRCTWCLKLSPHLNHVLDFESGIFFLELAEVVRRWIWIFLRVETEFVRMSADKERSSIAGPRINDALLGDYGGDGVVDHV